MYNSRFGRCGFPCFGPGNRMSRSFDPKRNSTASCTRHEEGKCESSGNEHGCSRRLLLKSSAFGGLVLPEGMVREATYHVASLNLDTSGCRDFLVLLNFSCNITANVTNLHLRFQMFRQEKCQPFSVPISSGVLYSRQAADMESNAFTLSVCDRDSMVSPCCCYSVYVDVSGAGAGGAGLVANPVLTASVMENH